MPIWVINEVSYVFDGELYIRPDGGGVNPMVAYADQTAAETKALQRAIDLLRSEDMSEFCYEPADLFPQDCGNLARATDILSHYGSFKTIEEFDRLLKLANDDELAEVSRLMDFQFYEVTEIELVP